MDVGPASWQKACFVPTNLDAFVTGFSKTSMLVVKLIREASTMEFFPQLLLESS